MPVRRDKQGKMYMSSKNVNPCHPKISTCKSRWEIIDPVLSNIYTYSQLDKALESSIVLVTDFFFFL